MTKTNQFLLVMHFTIAFSVGLLNHREVLLWVVWVAIREPAINTVA